MLFALVELPSPTFSSPVLRALSSPISRAPTSFSPPLNTEIWSGPSCCVCSQPSLLRRLSFVSSRNRLRGAGTRNELLRTCAWEATADLVVV